MLQVRNAGCWLFSWPGEGLQRLNPGGGGQEVKQLEELWLGNLPRAAAFAPSSPFPDSHIHFFTPWPRCTFPGSQTSRNARAVTWAPESSRGKHLRCCSGGFSKVLSILPSVSENLTVPSRHGRQREQGGNEAAGLQTTETSSSSLFQRQAFHRHFLPSGVYRLSACLGACPFKTLLNFCFIL